MMGAFDPSARIGAGESLEIADRLRRSYFAAFAELRSNCQRIGLLFDHAGDDLGKSIQDFYVRWHHWIDRNFQNCPSDTDCQEKMNDEIAEIEQKIKPLWGSLSNDGPSLAQPTISA